MFPRLRVVIALLGPFGLFSPAMADGDWTGKTVLLKKGGIKISGTAAKDKQVVVASLQDLEYRVLQDEGGQLKVKQDGVEGWFDKADAVVMEEAIDFFTGRIQANSNDARSYCCRGAAWQYMGQLDNALKDYSEAIRINPNEATWWSNRGVGWHTKKDYDKAIKDYEEALRLDPKRVATYLNRAAAWAAKKDYDMALKDYEEAFRIDANNLRGHNEMAWLLATCPDPKLRDGKRAVTMATKACELTDWKSSNELGLEQAKPGWL